MARRTVTFKSVLWGVAKRDGLIPEDDDLDRSAATQIAEGINSAYKFAWEYYDWPEATVIAEMTPVENPSQPGSRFIPYVDESASVDTLLEIWQSNPLTTARPKMVEYKFGPDGIYLFSGAGEKVWVKYRGRPPQFVSTPWDDAAVYAQGDIVYYPQTGDCYVANAATSAGQAPGASPWEKVDLLFVLSEATKAGAYALYLGGDGQKGAGALMEQAMVNFLDHEIDVIDNQMGATKTIRR
jgi:hypothetical protein